MSALHCWRVAPQLEPQRLKTWSEVTQARAQRQSTFATSTRSVSGFLLAVTVVACVHCKRACARVCVCLFVWGGHFTCRCLWLPCRYLQDLEDLHADITASLEDLIVDKQVREATTQRDAAWAQLEKKLDECVVAIRNSAAEHGGDVDLEPLQSLLQTVVAAPGADESDNCLPATHHAVIQARGVLSEFGAKRQERLAQELRDGVVAALKAEDADGIEALVAKFEVSSHH